MTCDAAYVTDLEGNNVVITVICSRAFTDRQYKHVSVHHITRVIVK